MAKERKGIKVKKWDEVHGSFDGEVVTVLNDVGTDISIGEGFQNLRMSTGMNRKEFSEWLDIPYRTMQDWELNKATMPKYLYALVEYKVQHEFSETKQMESPKDINKLFCQTHNIEEMIEQNDNQLDGIINNLPMETVFEKEAKTSVREKLKVQISESDHKPMSLCSDWESR